MILFQLPEHIDLYQIVFSISKTTEVTGEIGSGELEEYLAFFGIITNNGILEQLYLELNDLFKRVIAADFIRVLP